MTLSDSAEAAVQAGMIKYHEAQEEIKALRAELVAVTKAKDEEILALTKEKEGLAAQLDSNSLRLHDIREESERNKTLREEAEKTNVAIQTQMTSFTTQMGNIHKELLAFCEKHWPVSIIETNTPEPILKPIFSPEEFERRLRGGKTKTPAGEAGA